MGRGISNLAIKKYDRIKAALHERMAFELMISQKDNLEKIMERYQLLTFKLNQQRSWDKLYKWAKAHIK